MPDSSALMSVGRRSRFWLRENAQQLGSQLRAALHRVLGIDGEPPRTIVERRAVDKLHAAHDDIQQIGLKSWARAAGQLADRLHLLRLYQGALRASALAYSPFINLSLARASACVRSAIRVSSVSLNMRKVSSVSACSSSTARASCWRARAIVGGDGAVHDVLAQGTLQ